LNGPRQHNEWLAPGGKSREKRSVTGDDGSRSAIGTLTGLDTETLPPLTRDAVGADPMVVGLSVLCHPDPRRIGEQAHLQPLALGRTADLSRTEPEFRHPGSTRGKPLADPYISRRPLQLRLHGQHLQLTGELTRQALVIDGVEVQEDVQELDRDSMQRGVVLELAGRVALLAHFLPMPRNPGPDLEMAGHSEVIEKVRAQVLRVATADVPVLLRGESGTGKELVARAIHAQSERRDGPFVSVNMAAIPATTAASGLFGHVKGAFTGATAPSTGYFGRADGGTLFLDEIGDTPLEIQALLLRALESGEIQPVGAQAVRQADARVIAATEADLEASAAAGNFRPAFLHRLAGFEIKVPPLRERPDDVPRLLVRFLEEELDDLGQRHKLEPPVDRTAPPPLDVSLVSRLVRHRWPGNVRQLRNVSRHLAISSQALEVIRGDRELDDLLDEGADEAAHRGRIGDREGALPASPRRRTSPQEIADLTDDDLVEALRACQFRPGPAAERLGIGRTTLYKLMEKSTSIRKASDITDDELGQRWDDCDGDVQSMAAALEVSERALKLRLKRFKR
jgi:two-component system nitrogen regulation response regulator GlnG